MNAKSSGNVSGETSCSSTTSALASAMAARIKDCRAGHAADARDSSPGGYLDAVSTSPEDAASLHYMWLDCALYTQPLR
jgi:hypothetical protein